MMHDLFYLLAAFLGLAVALGAIAIAAPRPLSLKVVALAVVVLFVPATYFGFAQLLSRPKPVDLEWLANGTDEATVLSSTMSEGKAIYLWLSLSGIDEPRAYVLTWNRDMAEELQKARREAERDGGSVRMKLPFEPGIDPREPKFYALPQPALPPKDVVPGRQAPDEEPDLRT